MMPLMSLLHDDSFYGVSSIFYLVVMLLSTLSRCIFKVKNIIICLI